MATDTQRLDVQAEEDVNLLTGAPVVSIRYRVTGTRRWSKVVVFLNDDQTAAEVIANAYVVAESCIAGEPA